MFLIKLTDVSTQSVLFEAIFKNAFSSSAIKKTETERAKNEKKIIVNEKRKREVR